MAQFPSSFTFAARHPVTQHFSRDIVTVHTVCSLCVTRIIFTHIIPTRCIDCRVALVQVGTQVLVTSTRSEIVVIIAKYLVMCLEVEVIAK